MLIEAPVRQQDMHGSGEFGALRGGRTHRGIDIACYKGSIVKSVCNGRVTRVGYPYNPKDHTKGHLRYVQVTDDNGYEVRYFYVKPTINVGTEVREFDDLGVTQGLEEIYPGISEIKTDDEGCIVID